MQDETNIVRALDQAALGLLYALVMRLRKAVWRLRRPRLMGVRALIVRDEQVLLIRHRSGRVPWALPGGGVKRHERLEQAACREAAEETGARVRAERLLGVYDRFGGGVSNYIAVFVCAPIDAGAWPGSRPRLPRSLEIAEARFFPLGDLPSGTDPGTRRRVAEYAAGERGLARLW